MRSLARWGSLPLLGLPLGSWAASLGDIEANSFLNQPLDAEITLTATPEELAGLSIALAPVSAFDAAGVDYPALLNSIEFDIGRNAAGENVVVVSSTQSITEPFITLLVQLSFPRGSFTREYTVLLDPPLFLPANVAPEAIAAPVTRDPAPGQAGGAIAREPVAPVRTPQAASAAPVPAPAPAPRPVAAEGGDYTVQSGDTLWGIAERNRPAGVSTNQAMISIFEANSAAFEGNINRLRRGAILRIPPAATQRAIATAAANVEVQRQIDEWRSGVQSEPRLVLIPPSDEATASGAAVGAAGGDPAAVAALESEVSDLQAELAAARAEAAEAERLLQVQSAELANLQNQAVEEPAPAAQAEDQIFVDEEPEPIPPAVEETVVDAEPEPAEQPPVTVVDTRATGPSLVDRVIEIVTQPLVLGAGGLFIVLLGLLAFLRRRNDEAEDVTGQWEALEAELDEEADHAATARIRAQAAEPNMVVVEGHQGEATAEERKLGATAEIEALGTGTAEFEAFDGGTAEINALTLPGGDDSPSAIQPGPKAAEIADQTLSSQTVINLDQADPIAEADFHMAYGLYDQAADLITKSLSADPGNFALKLKLLEVFFVWGNKESFLESAQALRGDIGPANKADWDKVVIMGKQICPDEPLFSEATAAAGEIDLDLEAGSASAGLDFAFDEAEGDAVDLDLGMVPDGDLALEASGRHSATEEDMLAIGERTQAGLEAALLDVTDDEGGLTSPGGEIGDLDATIESPTVEASMAKAREDFDGLTLESPTVEIENADAPTVESPTIEAVGPNAGDGSDTVDQPGPASSAATADMTAEIALDDLGLDIGDLENLPGADDDLLSATGVTQVLHDQDDIEFTGTAIIDDDEATMMAPGLGSDPTGIQTAVLEQPVSSFEPETPESEDDLDLNLDDFSTALDGGGETVEQPIASRFSGVDLDVGNDVKADDEPTGTEEVSPLDPQTMTEVGTKLDLARAYIDMGDPEGAKSILEEVLSEGDAGQRSEAQTLIDALPA